MIRHTPFQLTLANGTLPLGPSPVTMGIVNVTPDSFSDGGDSNDVWRATAHAKTLLLEGADIIDIGGESTRPEAEELPVQQELDRTLPVIERICSEHPDVLLSVDTYKALVADQAIQVGARIINDVHGLQRDPEIADVAALHHAPVIIMHWDDSRDSKADIISEMSRYFMKSLEIADNAGIARDAIVLDPGFGFSKSLSDNYEILRRMDELHSLGFPILTGTSRKSMIGKVLSVPPKERVSGTIATSVLAYTAGAHIFRVHDVRENREALAIAEATLYGPEQQEA